MDTRIDIEHLIIIIIMLIPIIISLISFCGIYRVKKMYKIFRLGTKDKNMEFLLEKYIRLVEEIKNKNINMEERISKVENAMLDNIQKLGIVRYDALSDMSSNLSFSLALLDGRDTGVVITELYLRNSSTIYLREIKNGICDINLSKEEQEAIMVAKNIKQKKGDVK